MRELSLSNRDFPVLVKCCTKCKQIKPLNEFHKASKNSQSKGGLQSACKQCRAAYNKVRYAKNRQKIGLVCKEWRQDNKEKRNQIQKAYRTTLQGQIAVRIGNIKRRCENSNDPSYKNYGARGIKLCFTPIELYDWCVEQGVGLHNKEIHRIDNDGHYALDNIEFLTKEEHIQAHLEPVPF